MGYGINLKSNVIRRLYMNLRNLHICFRSTLLSCFIYSSCRQMFSRSLSQMKNILFSFRLYSRDYMNLLWWAYIYLYSENKRRKSLSLSCKSMVISAHNANVKQVIKYSIVISVKDASTGMIITVLG